MAEYACFQIAIGGQDMYFNMYDSQNQTPATIGTKFRPVVTLSPNVKIEACTGENSETNTHTITQY